MPSLQRVKGFQCRGIPRCRRTRPHVWDLPTFGRFDDQWRRRLQVRSSFVGTSQSRGRIRARDGPILGPSDDGGNEVLHRTGGESLEQESFSGPNQLAKAMVAVGR
ncbi:hypothetical protein R1flu_000158 [Riccia fluitans]|uniref:Uncharacterized protein n=1 Tax=Riccia fluitans TaxID=41844 RepID=A0ABD1XZT9_9MARC